MKSILVMLVCVIGSTSLFAQNGCCSVSSCVTAFNTGLIDVDANTTLLEFNGEYRSYKTELRRLNQKIASNYVESVWLKQAIIKYNINRWLSFNATVPYLILTANTKEVLSSLGDASVVTQIQPFSNRKLFFGAGLKFPTGKYQLLFNLNTSFIGTGSLDPLLSIQYHNQWKKIGLQNTAFARFATKGFNNTHYGNFYTISCMANLKIWSVSNDSLMHQVFFGLLSGVSFEYYGLQKTNGDWNVNTGGQALWVPFYLHYNYNKWQILGGVSFPALQQMHGIQPQQLDRFKLTLTKKF